MPYALEVLSFSLEREKIMSCHLNMQDLWRELSSVCTETPAVGVLLLVFVQICGMKYLLSAFLVLVLCVLYIPK